MIQTLRRPALLLCFLFATWLPAANAGVGDQAPEWDVSEWMNGSGTSLQALRGKVVILEFFQLWCPGCNSFSIPLMERWRDKYRQEIESGDLVLVSIHTVFEGHSYQDNERLKSFLKEKGITHLVGVDRHLNGDHLPQTMKSFRTRGTPEMAIIGPDGRIRLQRFGGFRPQQAEALIQSLLPAGS